MEDITIERKLELVQQIRKQYNKNQCDMSNRERILYGRTSGSVPSYEGASDTKVMSESLKLRSILAVMLIGFVIIIDFWGVDFAGMEIKQIFNIIAADYKENMTELAEVISFESR